MADRLIFPSVQLFKKTIEEYFLIASREIYKIHPAYTFDEDMQKTKIHIQPSYADVESKSKVPRLLTKVGEYEFSLQDTFYNNMEKEIRNELNVVSGYQSFKMMNTTVSVSVKAYLEEESSDLADELSMLGVYAARHMYEQMGLLIQGVNVSATREVDPSNDLYETLVVFRVEVPWKFKTFTGKEADGGGIEFEIPDDTNGYRAPGVYVYKYRNNGGAMEKI